MRRVNRDGSSRQAGVFFRVDSPRRLDQGRWGFGWNPENQPKKKRDTPTCCSDGLVV